jgi:anti-sigma factor (TIGR02949 family)
MSCGSPHETDCAEVIDKLYVYLDGEDSVIEHERIEVHLHECEPCLRQYGLEEAVKALVSRCCKEQAIAPEEVRAKVLARLAEVRADIARSSGH